MKKTVFSLILFLGLFLDWSFVYLPHAAAFDRQVYALLSAPALSPAWLSFWKVVTRFGNFEAVVLILFVGLVILLSRGVFCTGLFSFSFLIFGLQINSFLKTYFHQLRPHSYAGVTALTSYSYPSGHAFGGFVMSIGLWLAFEALLPKKISRFSLLFAVLFLLAIGFSRLAIGVHWFSDIIGGFLEGAIWLSLFNIGLKYYSRFEPVQSSLKAKRDAA